MREWIYDSWNSVMNAEVSPLRNIPDTMVRHMELQILAWMWCIAFSMIVGSFVVFGISMVAHVVLLALSLIHI